MKIEVEDLKNGTMQMNITENGDLTFSGTYADMRELVNEIGSFLRGESLAGRPIVSASVEITRPFYVAEVTSSGIDFRLRHGFGKKYGEFVTALLTAGGNDDL